MDPRDHVDIGVTVCLSVRLYVRYLPMRALKILRTVKFD